ncbi:MAG: AAA family ATPase [Candidatus Binatia bacterium]
MECPRCRHENRATASFCGECGAAFGDDDPCPRCATVNPSGHRFCDGCGERLVVRGTHPSPGAVRIPTPTHLVEKILRARGLEGERKLVTVLFADVVHSMQLAEGVDPEEWHRVLDRFFHILAAGIHRFEGTINQFTGDGIMALFGAPIAHEDHARRGCHAALDLLGALGEYASVLAARGLPFAVRMGLNSGEVVLGRIGDDLRMEYTALGHTVGLAARMEQMAAPGTVYLTEHTARLVEGFFTLRSHGTPAMKGVSAPIGVYELVGPGTLRTRLDASRQRGFSRLVGREAELARLWRILEQAIAANGQVVGVVGDAGVGKSRVCLEFVERCRAQGIAVHEAHCPSHGEAVPLLPIRELVRSCFGLGPDDSEADVQAKVRRRLAALDEEPTGALPLVFDLLGLPGEGPSPRLGDGESRQARLVALVGRLVRKLSATEPLVLLVDDAHWIDPASEECLREVADVVRGTRTLVVANFRPEYGASWMEGAHCHRVALTPLTHEASQALLADLLGAEASVGELFEVIGERTGGNPFFIEEVVQALAAAGSLAGRPGSYRLAAPVETLTIPATVHSLLAARIDRLGEDVKRVLQIASVIGKQFDKLLLREVAAYDDRALGVALGVLQEAEFVHEVQGHAGARYAFRHPLTQEVAYHSQLGDRRARLHAAVATALERIMADRLGEHAALIAHHWDAAGMRYEAVRWQRRAALRVSNIRVRGRGRWGGTA